MRRGGTFLGSITILPSQPQAKPLNLALTLLRHGLAKLLPTVDPSRLPNGAELVSAQRSAQEGRVKVGGGTVEDEQGGCG